MLVSAKFQTASVRESHRSIFQTYPPSLPSVPFGRRKWEQRADLFFPTILEHYHYLSLEL